MDRKLETIDVDWDGMISGVRTGHYDIMFVPISHVNDSFVDFSIPFMEVDSVLITRKGFPYNGIESLNNPEIRMVTGTKSYDQEIVRRNFPKAKKVFLPIGQSPIIEVLQGKSDFAVNGPFGAMIYGKKYPGKLDIHYERVGRLVMAISILKIEDKTLLNTINEFLKNYIKEGKVDRLVKKYLGEISKEYKKYGTKFDCSVGQEWTF